MTLSPTRAKPSLQSRKFRHRGQTYSTECLACSDFINCCGNSHSNQYDGASPSKKPGISRRDFLKILGGVSAVLAAAPFAAAGGFLVPQVPTKFTPQVIASTSDVPVNGQLIYWFPFTTDPTYTNLLIHLPSDLAQQAGSEWVSYNRTCIHLQCLTSFLGAPSEIIGCPCHGSEYRVTDGWPVAGPAAEIGRYLPPVQISVKGDQIYAENIDLNAIGYGTTSAPTW